MKNCFGALAKWEATRGARPLSFAAEQIFKRRHWAAKWFTEIDKWKIVKSLFSIQYKYGRL